MNNQNDSQSYNREIQQDSYNDAEGHTHTNVTRVEETINNSTNPPNPESYKDGYVQGVVSEQSLTERDENNASRGLLIGILVTGLAGLTAAAVFFLNQRDREPAMNTVAPAPVVVPQKPSPKQTTIIEKTKEVPVPVLVPQQQAPAPTVTAQPQRQNINISIPTSKPSAEKPATSTQTSPTQSKSRSDSGSTASPKSDSTTSTPITSPKSDSTTSTPTTSPKSDSTTSTPTTSSKSDSTTSTPSSTTSSPEDSTSSSSGSGNTGVNSTDNSAK